jgi:hypothetical protein
MIDPSERRTWVTLQTLYEGISGVNKVPVIGPWTRLFPLPPSNRS